MALDPPRTVNHRPAQLSYDFVVAGAGPGGLSAAIAAGRAGLRTALIERHGFLAGTVNVGLCIHGLEDGLGRRVVGGCSWELIERCIAAGGSVGPVALDGAHMFSTTPVDMAVFQKCALEMLAEAGVDLWLHTLVTQPTVERGRISALRAWCGDGEIEFRARSFLDATGHAEIAYRAGAPTRSGRVQDGAMQPMSLGMTMAPVDIDAMMNAVGGNCGKAVKPGGSSEDYVWFTLLLKPWADQLAALGVRLGRQGACWGNSIYPRIVNLNAVKVLGRNGADARDLSRAEIESRGIAIRFADFLRENVAGFREAYIVRVSPFIGIRETRHIDGLYTLSPNDARRGEIADDSIALCGYPVDIHDPHDGVAEFEPIGGGRFGICYRSLVPKGIDNLLVSGRAISASDAAFGSVRVMGACLAIGEAAGEAAVMAHRQDVEVSALDGRLLRRRLEAQAVMIL